MVKEGETVWDDETLKVVSRGFGSLRRAGSEYAQREHCCEHLGKMHRHTAPAAAGAYRCFPKKNVTAGLRAAHEDRQSTKLLRGHGLASFDWVGFGF